MHALLHRQLAKATEPSGSVDIDRLCELIDSAYAQFDTERSRTDRATQLMIAEVTELAKERNAALESLEEQNRQLSALKDTLEQRVVERTAAAEKAAQSSQFANWQLLAEIRQRQAAEERLRSSNEALQRATEAKTNFLAMMSHEIRTPMNGVLGMADLLSRTGLTSHQQRLVSTINQSASTLLTLINDILDLSRIEAGKMEIDSADFDLHEGIESVLEVFARQAQKQNLELSLRLPSNIPRFVKGDAPRLRQVLTNLLGNALKFTRSGEIAVGVTLEAENDGRHVVRISVRDTGIGIDPKSKDLLFKPFTQADSSITRRFGGTGLGLSITRRLVQLMGGEITLESELGKGTTVEFTACLDKSSRTDIPAPVCPSVIRGQRVLVVDDRATNCEIISSYLSDCGALPDTAGSASEALAKMQQAADKKNQYLLVILDMLLPGLNGLELAKRIKADPALAQTRLIMLTSLNWQDDKATAKDLGIAEFLYKPIRRSELLEGIGRCFATPVEALPRIVQKTQERATRPTLDGVRVLVAEDNPVNQEVIREYVRELGCDLHMVENGVAAVEAFASNRFDIVLMDCQMPEMDGLTACRKIREHERKHGLERIPVIAVTANAYDSDRAICLAAEMDDFMSKPFTEGQLSSLLDKWVKRPEPASAQTSSPADASHAAEPERHATLDHAKLQKFESLKPGMGTRLRDLFLATGSKSTDRIMAAVVESNHAGIRDAAHALKSSSAYIGADELSRLAAKLEGQARATEPMADCLLTAAMLETELRAVEKALDSTRSIGELLRVG